jgi:hypothetical protein
MIAGRFALKHSNPETHVHARGEHTLAGECRLGNLFHRELSYIKSRRLQTCIDPFS